MANFIEYASKAQEELNKEKTALEAREGELQTKSNSVSARSAELDKREAAVAQVELDIAARKEQLSFWEKGKKREEEVQGMFDDAVSKLAQADEKAKKAAEYLAESKQVREEVQTREIRLTERESKYKEEIKQELMNRFLGVK